MAFFPYGGAAGTSIPDEDNTPPPSTIPTDGLMTLGFNVQIDGALTLTQITNAANDAAAAAAGVQVGSIYRNGTALMIRTV
jgi:hypothetical protein